MNNGLINTHPVGRKAQANIALGRSRGHHTTPSRQAFNRRFELYRAGYTQRDLAADLEVSPEIVSMVINDHKTSGRIAARMAELTGVSLERLWPCGKYDQQGASV